MKLRKDAAFRNETVAASLPGTVAEIAKRSGYSRNTVLLALAQLLADGKAYADRWTHTRNAAALHYVAGAPPKGYTVPTRPEPLTQAQRDAAWRATPQGQATVNAASLRAHWRKHEAALARMKRYRDANRERINEKARAKAAKDKRAAELREAAHNNILLQLTLPKSVDE